MTKWSKALATVLGLALLSGCWNRTELPEKAFIMGVALEESKGNKSKIAVQIFRPSQKAAGRDGGGGSKAFTNIETEGATTFDAVRDITLHVGRKAQWAHMRIIIINEALVVKNNLLALLEYFYRDHETRITTKVVIAQKGTKNVLDKKPLIELTSSQQLNRIQQVGYLNTGKVTDMDLLKLAQGIKSETGITIMPIISVTDADELVMQGTAIIEKGLMVGKLSGRQTQDIQMLSNKYKKGVLKVPCQSIRKAGGQSNETIEVQSIHTKITPIPAADSLQVKLQVNIRFNIGELHCSNLDKVEDEEAFLRNMEQSMQERLSDTVRMTQQKQVDVLGIGNMLYRTHTKLWKKWKPDWSKRYADAQMKVKVTVQLENSLTTIGKPLSKQ